MALVAATAAATALSTAPGAEAAGRHPAPRAPIAKPNKLQGFAGKISGLDRSASGRHVVFVRFTGKGAADVARSTGSSKAARSRRGEVTKLSSSMLGTARKADSKAQSLYVTSNAIPGMAMSVDVAGIKALAARSDVAKISRIVPKTTDNANTAALVKALNNWKFPGGTGKGVDVGIIDTGLDYTHADFGGAGTSDAYDNEDPTDGAWLDNLTALGAAKIMDGWDLVGDDYNADPDSPAYQPVPNPDPNPLDCNGHGTHVAGTAAGYGVTAGGATFTGSYGLLTAAKLMNMKVGPGMAPQARLFPIKVFGCEGSTDVTLEAMDIALDPNGDGDFSDHLDVINMSLGSTYGYVDDPENEFVNELASHGVMPVMSMGNNGDLTDTGGSPGNAVSSLAVASTVDSYQLRDGLKVNAPASVAGTAAGQFSIAYDWANAAPVTGDVAAIPGSNADGCQALSPTDAAKVAGKVAWLIWDDNDATRRCGSVARSGNVAAAGAIGAVFTSGLDVFGAGITGSSTIPVIQLPKAWVTTLQPAVDAGTLNVTFDGTLQGTIKDITPSISDTISDFTSRGPHGSIGVVKPDVAAPGDTIASAGFGTGSAPAVYSGTSMASPLTAGTAAVVRAKHPSWTPVMVKAAIMNTAGNDLWTGPNKTGTRYAPARVGAGRVDAFRAATTSVLAYVNTPANAVSASFGVVPAPISGGTVTKTLPMTVRNTGKTKVTVALKYESVNASPGVSYSVSPSTITLGAGKSATAKVTMKVQPSALRHTIDKTMAVDQLGVPRQFVSDSSGRVLVTPSGSAALRVPVYGAAKPVSTTTASVEDNQIVFTGAGVEQGTGATAYKSFTSVMQLGAKSGTLPECEAGADPFGCTSIVSERAGDIKTVGAGATDDWLWFGISTYGDWANVGNVFSPYVDYDVTGDGNPDLETFVTNLTDTDVLVAVTVDYNTGDTYDIEPVNFNFGDVDTNVFDTNVILLPVWKDYIGLPTNGDSAPISYTAAVLDGFAGGDIDSVEVPDTFDAGAPALSTAGPLFRDNGGNAIDVTATAPGLKALVFHLHGAAGAREQVLTITSPTT